MQAHWLRENNHQKGWGRSGGCDSCGFIAPVGGHASAVRQQGTIYSDTCVEMNGTTAVLSVLLLL